MIKKGVAALGNRWRRDATAIATATETATTERSTILLYSLYLLEQILRAFATCKRRVEEERKGDA